MKTRHLIAGLAATALVVGMIGFVYFMGARADVWVTQSVKLSLPARLLYAFSTLIATYWFVVYPGVILACFSVAELLGGGSHEGPEG